jgi:hypothetical protein
MYSSTSLKRREATNELLWLVVATAVGFVLAGLLVRIEGPRSAFGGTKIEFTAKEYYDC